MHCDRSTVRQNGLSSGKQAADGACRMFSLALFLLCLASFILSGCGGGQAVRDGGEQSTATSSPPDTSARRGMVPAKRGGGYYKDDGPGDEIPDNLDDLPDATPRQEPLHRFANKPYTVLGKSYVPQTRVRPFRQRGIASWYGKKFHGQKTSIGERYDMFSMTAAHPTLPLPSYVRVTNPANGKNVVVRVNDRGPFHADRVIDLSYAAAHRLGYIDKGSTLVELESILPDNLATNATGATSVAYEQVKPPVVGIAGERDEIELLAARMDKESPNEAPSSLPTQAPANGIYLQIGAFSSSDNAESLRAHLAREFDWLDGTVHIVPGGRLYRVQVGPYAQRGEAEKAAEQIRLAYGQKPRLVVR